MERILILVPRRAAAFCVNDLIALALQAVVSRPGLSTPREFSITGYGGIGTAELAQIPITSVRRTHYELGQAASTLMLEAATHRSAETLPVFLAELVVRQST
jgi:DNA-binding LacI/PurR family transcriptional regulator